MTTTLCGRQSLESKDGTNVAESVTGITCKFCLRLLANMSPEQQQQMEREGLALLTNRD